MDLRLRVWGMSALSLALRLWVILWSTRGALGSGSWASGLVSADSGLVLGFRLLGGVGVGVGVAAFSVGQALWDDSMRKVGKNIRRNSEALNPRP